jgi:SAM-dependent methyltransferase
MTRERDQTHSGDGQPASQGTVVMGDPPELPERELEAQEAETPRKRRGIFPGFIKRMVIHSIRFLIHHPVDQMVRPLEHRIAETQSDLRAASARTEQDLHDLRAELADAQESVAILEAANRNLEVHQRSLQASLASFELTAQELIERTATGEAQLDSFQAKQSNLEGRLGSQRSELSIQRARVELMLREARRALPDTLSDRQLTGLVGDLDRLLGAEYDELENVFRGTRDSIRERQSVYLGDVAPLSGQAAPLLDIGCGRGEWLELLRDHDVPAYGIDPNQTFVQANVERGLDAKVGDALSHLRELDESSLAAVTAFHVIEHLPFEQLVETIDGALRALRPGGLLIFETPNPQNLAVGASTFHIDPTHSKPVHPLLLEHLLLSRGFADVELRYLHPAPELQIPAPEDQAKVAAPLRRLVEQINSIFFGPQDYAAVARKPAPENG